MAFYSYVILLLTHIGIGAVAHGGGSQRRARTLNKEVQGDRDSGLCLPAQAVSLAKGAPPLGSPPWPAGTGGGAAGSQHWRPAPPPPLQAGTRTRTVSPEEWLKDLVGGEGWFGWEKGPGRRKQEPVSCVAGDSPWKKEAAQPKKVQSG